MSDKKTFEADKELAAKILSDGKITETAESASEATIYPVDKVHFAGRTKFVEELLICENKTQGIFLVTDGELQSATSDEAIYHEHLIHPTVLLHAEVNSGALPKDIRVLVLGAGEGATVRELLKYEQVSRVLWNDIDPGLVDLCEEHMKMNEGKYKDEVYAYGGTTRVERLYEDANTLLPRLVAGSYDIIVNDLPDPGEGFSEATGLYSSKFFAEMSRVLAPGGIVVTHAGPCSPNKMGVRAFLESGLKAAGFTSTTLGLVPIPSFQSEWGYLYAVKDGSFPSQPTASLWEKAALSLPEDVRIMDAVTLQRFFLIPPYYERRN